MAVKCNSCDHVGLLHRDFEIVVVDLASDHQEPGLFCSNCGMTDVAEHFQTVHTTAMIKHRTKIRWLILILVVVLVWWLI